MDNPTGFFKAAMAALICAVLLFLTVSKLRNIKTKGQKMVEHAKRAGCVAQGHLLKSSFHGYDPFVEKRFRRRAREHWEVEYSYEVDGVSYLYSGALGGQPPEIMLLYYEEGRPDKAFPEGYINFGLKYSIVYYIPVILLILFYKLFFS